MGLGSICDFRICPMWCFVSLSSSMHQRVGHVIESPWNINVSLSSYNLKHYFQMLCFRWSAFHTSDLVYYIKIWVVYETIKNRWSQKFQLVLARHSYFQDLVLDFNSPNKMNLNRLICSSPSTRQKRITGPTQLWVPLKSWVPKIY